MPLSCSRIACSALNLDLDLDNLQKAVRLLSCSFRVPRLSKMWWLLQASSAAHLSIEQSPHIFLSIYVGIAVLNSVFTLVSATSLRNLQHLQS